MKIQKLIADSGFCSRRQAENLILNQQVICNNKPATIGMHADLNCKIKINGREINLNPPKKIYLILNKPEGVISTTKDNFGRKTVIDLIKTKTNQRVFLIGRLDLNSQGLVMLTNDGCLAQKISHPKYNITKKYEVSITRKLKPFEIYKLQNGMWLNGRKTAPAKIKPVSALNNKIFKIEIELHEGKKRQIRRMIYSIDPNIKILKLKRTSIGPIKLNNLPPGHSRFLNHNEILKLKQHFEQKNNNHLK